MITEQERIIRKSQGFDIGFEYNDKKYWINSSVWDEEKEKRLFQETGLKSFREGTGNKNLVLYNPEYFSEQIGYIKYLKYCNSVKRHIPQPINMSSTIGMFYNSVITELDLSNWDMSNVTDMSNMFCYCRNLQSLDLSSWNVQNDTDISGMFYRCKSLNRLNLSGWSKKIYVKTTSTFIYCSKLIEIYCKKDRYFRELYSQAQSTESWCIYLLHSIIGDSNKSLIDLRTF